ncbi:uncharacterized protein SOCEGT47_017200 [Sorangium cellulosum]|uniref:Uncharacterized protein n=1 Tax=Sorangium cellulosum TaxID=56 RepID=A0A4P2PWY2_SORCE|nr:uncharacterized protein SOCEGT47_017200 [Sorangium cellulosum]
MAPRELFLELPRRYGRHARSAAHDHALNELLGEDEDAQSAAVPQRRVLRGPGREDQKARHQPA